MKKIQILTSLLVIFLAFACKNAGTETATTPAADTTAIVAAVDTMMMTTDTTAIAFVCTMHPEISGKDGDKCSKCGMALVSNKKAAPGHEGHGH